VVVAIERADMVGEDILRARASNATATGELPHNTVGLYVILCRGHECGDPKAALANVERADEEREREKDTTNPLVQTVEKMILGDKSARGRRDDSHNGIQRSAW
jgi:sirohydrochlorin ferrochelatase